MKRFDFSLERVRRWRDGQARLEELKLELLVGQSKGLGDEKRAMESAATQSQAEVLRQPSIEAIQLHSLDAYRRHTRSQVRGIEIREREAEAAVELQRQRVIQARRDAELLERLKRKALDGWQAANDREQETLAAELYLAKRARRR
jgi:hypothetical protein